MLAALASPWVWLVLGLVLAGLEIAAPGLFLIWLGLAALTTGLVALLVQLDGTTLLLLFAAFAVADVLIARRLTRRSPQREGDPALLNRRAEALLGREATLVEAIEAGEGRARLDDVVWRVAGADAPAGARVRVTGLEGTRLKVEHSTSA